MVWKDSRRFYNGDTDLNFNDHVNSTEYKEAMKLVKNNFDLDFVSSRYLIEVIAIDKKHIEVKICDDIEEAEEAYQTLKCNWYGTYVKVVMTEI